ncbi:hypothetical protein RD792_010876 [Penstemon davidsonii]|uniref:Pre-mRNA cleavage factor Im 25 kDa subunit n=1 Tax=Penstemon davidsonii TaxID=160366 RepID=A0ABR0D301_9LAMI|nr:hypothetical protein RD792_010876 [Penstemon davidsonii]
MDDRTAVLENGDSHHNYSNVLDIYPLGCYYFGSTDAVALKNETLADRALRMKAKYESILYFRLQFAILWVIVVSFSCMMMFRSFNLQVELFKHPHLLLLQVQNTIFKLPGGRLRPGESDVGCLKRKLSSKLSSGEDGRGPEWEIGECLGIWWKPNFEAVSYPYLPPNIQRPKECTKLFLVKLPASRRFIVPRNFKILAVPLCQVHDNDKVYTSFELQMPIMLLGIKYRTL